MRILRSIVPAALVLAAAACDRSGIIVDPGDPPGRPEDVTVAFQHQFEGFTSSGQPVGHPTVVVSWYPPDNWNREVFRVYAAQSGSSSFTLVATVTSCTVNGCTYVD